MTLTKTLQSFGLDDKEARVYLTSLELGDAPVSLIAQQAKIKRSTAYLIARALESKGLMGSFEMRGVLRFSAVAPETLLSQAKTRAEEIEKTIPEFKAISKKAPYQPKVLFYEGREGYVTAIERSLTVPNATVLHIGSLGNIWDVVGQDYDLKHYIPTRLKQKIKIRCLYFAKEVKNVFTPRNNASQLRDVRFLPENHFFPNSMLVFGDTVAYFTSPKEFVTVLIESKEIAATERQKFELLWQATEKS